MKNFLYGTAITILWLLPLALACELVARSAAWWTVHHNPYFAAEPPAGTGDSAPRPSVREVAVVTKAEEIVPWDLVPPELGKAAGEPEPRSRAIPRADSERLLRLDNLQAIVDGAERKRQYEAFFDLDDRGRELFAAMHDAGILVLDGEGAVRCVYGNNWIARIASETESGEPASLRRLVARDTLWQLVEAGLREVKRTGTVQSKTAPPEFDSLLFPFANDPLFGRCVYAFICPEYQSVLKSLPPDTPWDIPYIRYKKNLRNAYSGLKAPLDTNNHGFRGPDFEVPKPAGVFRILCVGGSTTEEGATADTTYPAIVERELAASFPDKRIEVVNCGTAGQETQGHLARLRDYLELEPDLIVLYEGVNDIRKYCLLSMLLDARRGLRTATRSQFLGMTIAPYLLPSSESVLRRMAAAYANLEDIGEIAASHGVRIVLCSLACPDTAHMARAEKQFFEHLLRTEWLPPYNLRAYSTLVRRYNGGMRDLCERHGIQYIPVAENMHGGVDYFEDLCHMTHEGITRKATIIAEYLEKYIQPAMQENPQTHLDARRPSSTR